VVWHLAWNSVKTVINILLTKLRNIVIKIINQQQACNTQAWAKRKVQNYVNLWNPCTMKEWHDVGYFTMIISKDVTQCALKMKCRTIFVIFWVCRSICGTVSSRSQYTQRGAMSSLQMTMSQMNVHNIKVYSYKLVLLPDKAEGLPCLHVWLHCL
jgi:hypothetical protein